MKIKIYDFENMRRLRVFKTYKSLKSWLTRYDGYILKYSPRKSVKTVKGTFEDVFETLKSGGNCYFELSEKETFCIQKR